MNTHVPSETGMIDNMTILSGLSSSNLAATAKGISPIAPEPSPVSQSSLASPSSKEEFNDMIGVRQLLCVLFDDVVAFTASGPLSAYHNIVISEDNRTWTDNGTGKTGSAFDLVEAVHPNDHEAEVERITAGVQYLSDTEDTDLRPENESPTLPEADFPLNRLPTKLRSMAEGIVEMEGVPAVMAASAVMGAASASLGNGIEIQSKNDKTACGNLFFLLDAPSGVGKSGTSDRAARPIRDFERTDNIKREQRRKQVAAELAKKERMQGNSGDAEGNDQTALEIGQLREELEQLKQSSYVIVGDTTTEKLASICAENGGATASFSGEARGIVQVLSGRYDKGSANDSFYLSAFSVEPFRQERIGRAGCLVERPCLSVMWMVQPDVFGKMWSTESFFEGGLLPRFLSCRTNAEIQDCSEERKVFSLAVQDAYHQVITELLETYRANREKPLQVVVTPSARKIIISYANRIVARRKAQEFSEKGECFASRWAELTWKLALVFHAVEHGRGAHLHEVQAETAMSALVVVSWFATQQICQIEEYEMSQLDQAEPKIMVLVSKYGRITARAVAKAGIVKNSSKARVLLQELEDQGLLVSELSHGKGRPTRHYSRPPNNTSR